MLAGWNRIDDESTIWMKNRSVSNVIHLCAVDVLRFLFRAHNHTTRRIGVISTVFCVFRCLQFKHFQSVDCSPFLFRDEIHAHKLAFYCCLPFLSFDASHIGPHSEQRMCVQTFKRFFQMHNGSQPSMSGIAMFQPRLIYTVTNALRWLCAICAVHKPSSSSSSSTNCNINWHIVLSRARTSTPSGKSKQKNRNKKSCNRIECNMNYICQRRQRNSIKYLHDIAQKPASTAYPDSPPNFIAVHCGPIDRSMRCRHRMSKCFGRWSPIHSARVCLASRFRDHGPRHTRLMNVEF